MSRLVCVGGALIDRKYTAKAKVLFDSSNPARASTHFGGVARNVAENLAQLGLAVSLLARVGDDAAGQALIHYTRGRGVDTSGVEAMRGMATDEYAAIVGPDGSLVLGMNDAGAVESLDVAHLERHPEAFASAKWVFVDANLSSECIAWLLARKRSGAFRLAADGVSEAKVHRLGAAFDGDLLFLKEAQARAYLHAAADVPASDLALQLRERGAACIVLTRGASGCVVASAAGVSTIPAVEATPVDATGAGDALIAATLYRMIAGDAPELAVAYGTLLATITIESNGTVVDLSPSVLKRQEHRLLR